MVDFFVISVDNWKIGLSVLMNAFLSPGDYLKNQWHHYLGNKFNYQLLKWYIHWRWFVYSEWERFDTLLFYNKHLLNVFYTK